MTRILLPLATLAALTSAGLSAEPGVDRNVVYGMYSGLALLMDVYRPDEPNGHGIVVVHGSGWHSSLAYGAGALKEGPGGEIVRAPLLRAGYTVFTINHRQAPRFRYPAAVEDTQRAVRFIRHHATEYGIRADRIGAFGGSSGAHLAALLGVLDGAGTADDPDPVNRQSAKVQAVVAAAAPTDFTAFEGSGVSAVSSFVGLRLDRLDAKSEEGRLLREASPASHVSADDAPLLLVHGDADSVVSFRQAEIMQAAMQKGGATVKLIRIPGGGHGFLRNPSKDAPDFGLAAVRWFDEHLRGSVVSERR